MKKLADSFVSAIKDNNFHDVAKENIEAVIDSFLQEGMVKDIPFLNSLIGLLKTGINVKEQLFLKKIIKFLIYSETATPEERLKIIEEIDSSKEYRIKVGEKLLYLIDKCDDYDKAGILGYLFKAVNERKLKYNDFLKCSLVLDKCLVSELDLFLKDDRSLYTVESDSDLLNWGLLAFAPFEVTLNNSELNVPKLEGGQLELKISDAGALLKLHLGDYLQDRGNELGISRMELSEIQQYLDKLEQYPEHKRFILIKEYMVHLCNNFKISDDDFNNLLTAILYNVPFLIYDLHTSINAYYKIQTKKGNDYNIGRWQKFYNSRNGSQII
ncbi:hypothetical protein [Flavobacterium sp. CSZ]|uniref:hypothetical protein n=1 Tax=Flavobacterium sp. CSZ TaxID=2783791 RepID=UPI00188C129D|nr:hypothetical protein [Flavobacterium sp. CSZ]MBF4485779.1 hypothetical protein [Flavobacterium sp. CSZ]